MCGIVHSLDVGTRGDHDSATGTDKVELPCWPSIGTLCDCPIFVEGEVMTLGASAAMDDCIGTVISAVLSRDGGWSV